jgi:hypothetical protein
MFTCPHCSGVYYINLFGEFEVAQHEPIVENNVETYHHEITTNQTINFSDNSIQQPPVNDGAPLMMDQDLIAADNVYEGTQITQFNSSQQEQHSLQHEPQFASVDSFSDQSNANEIDQISQNAQTVELTKSNDHQMHDQDVQTESENDQYSHSQVNYNFDQPLDQVLQQSQNISDAVESTEINEDQNLNAQNGQWYQLQISGIDTVQIRDLVQEAMTDQKLQIDVAQVLSKIINGQVVIKGLNAIKCSVIAQRLIYVDVELNWSRYENE